MTDLMQWLYTNHIKSYIQNQKPDEKETPAISFFEGGFTETEKEEMETGFSFYAVHGFRLGLKTGLALAEDLR